MLSLKNFQALVCLLVIPASCLTAQIDLSGDYCEATPFCEPTPCCEPDPCCDPCIETPYSQGRISFTAYTGFTPFVFTVKGPNYLFPYVQNPGNDPTITQLAGTHILYKTPWTVGAELGYMFLDNLEVFFDFNYGNASSKSKFFNLPSFFPESILKIETAVSEYRAYTWHLGSRYYFCGWDICGTTLTPFFGAKLGLIHRQSVSADIVVEFNTYNAAITTSPDPATSTQAALDTDTDLHGAQIMENVLTEEYNGTVKSSSYVVPDNTTTAKKAQKIHLGRAFKSGTTVSAGLQLGLNWDFDCNWCLSFKAEAIVQGQWETRLLSPPPLFSKMVVGSTGPVMVYPITIGLRYSF